MAKWKPASNGLSNQAVSTTKMQGDVSNSLMGGGVRVPPATRGIMYAVENPVEVRANEIAQAAVASAQGQRQALYTPPKPQTQGMGIGASGSGIPGFGSAPGQRRINPYAMLGQQQAPVRQTGQTETVTSALTQAQPAESNPVLTPEQQAQAGYTGITFTGPQSSGGDPLGQWRGDEEPLHFNSADASGGMDPEFEQAYQNASASIDQAIEQQRERDLYEARRMGYGPGMLAQIDANAQVQLQAQKNALWFEYMQAWWEKQARERGLDIQEASLRQSDIQASSVMQSASAMEDRLVDDGADPDTIQAFKAAVNAATQKFQQDRDAAAYDAAVTAAFAEASGKLTGGSIEYWLSELTEAVLTGDDERRRRAEEALAKLQAQ